MLFNEKIFSRQRSRIVFHLPSSLRPDAGEQIGAEFRPWQAVNSKDQPTKKKYAGDAVENDHRNTVSFDFVHLKTYVSWLRFVVKACRRAVEWMRAQLPPDFVAAPTVPN